MKRLYFGAVAVGKPSMKRRKPRSTKAANLKRADTEFSVWIRERDPNCFFYGVPQDHGRKTCYNRSSQNSHFWGRANMATRFDPLNCDGICGGCHMTHEGNKQGLYKELKIKQLGVDGYNALEKKARSTFKRERAIHECMQFLNEEKKKNMG